MSKYKFVNLIDKLFVTICVFLVVYAWINFYIKNLYLTFCLSLVFTFACVFLLYFFISKKQSVKTNKSNHIKDINEKFLAFKLLGKENKLLLISKILSLNYKTEIKNDMVFYTRNNTKTAVIFALNIEKLDEYNFINLLENLPHKIENVDIICNEILPNVNTKILKDVKINIITKQKLYEEFFAKYQIFPDCSKINKDMNKIKFKDILFNFFTPNKAKSFFFCGLILIFSSIILPYHIYYLISGTTLLISSIICKIKPLLKL